jgi:hypothetical protein
MNTLTVQTLSTIKLAAKKLSGPKRRAFQAQVTKDYLGGSGRGAERVFGWSRTTVEKGLRELETGRHWFRLIPNAWDREDFCQG